MKTSRSILPCLQITESLTLTGFQLKHSLSPLTVVPLLVIACLIDSWANSDKDSTSSCSFFSLSSKRKEMNILETLSQIRFEKFCPKIQAF